MSDPALLLNPSTLQIDAEPTDDELDALLDPIDGQNVPVVIPERELAEAIWNTESHPRWPPHSKDALGNNIGGQWMRVGQRFDKDGHTWEISHVAAGHIIANEASGKIGQAETRVFAPSMVDGHPTIAGAVPSAPKKLNTGSGKGNFNSTVTDGVVHPETHDPSIKLPSNSTLTPEEWQQFGKPDQLLYVEVMKRFGVWTPQQIHSPHGGGTGQGSILSSEASQLFAKAQQEFGSTSAVSLVKKAFASNKGSSGGGKNLSCTKVFDGVTSADTTALMTARKQYEQAREVQSELSGLMAWDLFNRTRSPDVTLFHGSGDNEGFFGSIVAGHDYYMSGLSNSWGKTWGESNTVVAAVPIRHLVFAEDLLGNYNHSSEHEFSWADRMRLSPITASFWTSSQLPGHGPINKWMMDHVSKNPAGGWVAKGVAAHKAGVADLPLPPATPDFMLKHQAGVKTYYIPPDDVMKKIEAAVAANPGQALTDEQQSASNLKPGDVFEKNTPGMRYLVIEDKGLAPGTVRYVALGKPPELNYDTAGDKLYTTTKGKKVNLHFDLPAEPAKAATVYDPSGLEPVGDEAKLKTFQKGEKLRFNGDDWEVIGQQVSATTVKSLSTGVEATMNPDWKSKKLEPAKPSFTPEIGGKALLNKMVVTINDPVDGKWNVTRPDGKMLVVQASALEPLPSIAPSSPQKGDTFTFDGTKMTVTNVLKNGTVRARGPAGSNWPTVREFEPGSALLKGLVRPSDYGVGPKHKLGQMEAGTLFSGSPAKVRPYMVLGTLPTAGGQPGKQTHVLNLDTGEVSVLSKNKSYPALVTAADVAETGPITTDSTEAPHDELMPGATVHLAQLKIGDTFHNNVGTKYQIIADAGSENQYWELLNLEHGDHATVAKNFTDPLTFIGTSEVGDETPTPAPTVESGELPDAVSAGFVPYGSNAGPNNAYKHDKVKMLAEGTVFLDKTGKAWKVKKAGAQPIITDGDALFKVDGNLRVKDAQHAKKPVVFHDNSSPVGAVGDTASKAAADKLHANPDAQSLAGLGLQPGDQFQMEGKVWTVDAQTGVASNLLPGVNVDTGNVKLFPKSVIPTKFLKHDTGQKPTPSSEVVPAAAFDAADKWMTKEESTPYSAQQIHDLAVVHHGKGKDWPEAYEEAHVNMKGFTGAGSLNLAVKDALEPAATAGPQPGKVENMLTTGAEKKAGTLGLNALALTAKGQLVYKAPVGEHHWFEVGGDIVPLTDAMVVTVVKPSDEVPKVADLKHTGVMMDVHAIQDGQVFWSGNHAYLMLGHGSKGVDAMRLEDGTILSGGRAQHKDFELATWDAVLPGVAPTPLEAPTPGPTVGDLKAGDKFTIPAGYSGEGSEYEVVDPTPIENPGVEGGSIATAPFTSVKVKPVPGPMGEVPAGAPQAIATALKPVNVKPAADEQFPESDGWWKLPSNATVKGVSMKPGDLFVDNDGNVHTVQKVTGSVVSDQWVTTKSDFNPSGEWHDLKITHFKNGTFHPPEPEPEPAAPTTPQKFGDLKVGDEYHFDDAGTNGTWEVVAKGPTKTTIVHHDVAHYGDSTHEVANDSPFKSSPVMIKHGAPSLAIKPYGSPYQSGGKKPYHKLSDLQPGDHFTDKSGNEFKVVGPESGGVPSTLVMPWANGMGTGDAVPVPHTFTDANGKAKPTRVKKLGSAAPSSPQSKGDALFDDYKGETVSDLGVGDVFKQSNSGTFWKVLSTAPLHIESVQSGKDTYPSDWQDSQPIVITKKGAVVPSEPDWGDQAGPIGAVIGQAMTGHTATYKGYTVTMPSSNVFHVSGPKGPMPVSPTDAVGLGEFLKNAPAHHVVPADWSTSPTPIDVTDMPWSVGDQWIDSDGDKHTVASVDEDGVPASTWEKPNGDSIGGGFPMPWPKGGGMTTTAWSHTPELHPGAPGAAGADQMIPDYSGTKLTGGSAAGGTTGAQIKKDSTGKKWLVKAYGGNQDRVATELLANAVYRTLGVKAAEAGKQIENGKAQLAYPLVDGTSAHFSGTDDAKMKALGEDFMADALVANYDFVGAVDDNVLWNGDVPTRIDQGGTFKYRAQGKPKAYGPVPTEVWSMLTQGQGKNGVKVSEAQLREQAAVIADTLTPPMIDMLVDQAPFKDEAMREDIRSALKARVQWMKGFAADDPSPVFAVPPDVKLEPSPEVPSESSGAMVKASDLQPGDKINLGYEHASNPFIVNGPSDDGQHWSVTNEEGWQSTTIPKDDKQYEHVGYATPPQASPSLKANDKKLSLHHMGEGDIFVNHEGDAFAFLHMGPVQGVITAENLETGEEEQFDGSYVPAELARDPGDAPASSDSDPVPLDGQKYQRLIVAKGKSGEAGMFLKAAKNVVAEAGQSPGVAQQLPHGVKLVLRPQGFVVSHPSGAKFLIPPAKKILTIRTIQRLTAPSWGKSQTSEPEGVPFDALDVGDHFDSAGGTWQKDAEDSAKLIAKHDNSQMAAVGETVDFGWKGAPVQYPPSTYQPPVSDGATVTPPTTVLSPPALPISPYGSPYQSGGKAPYHKLTDLAVGDLFRDKTGKVYSVMSHVKNDAGQIIGSYIKGDPEAGIGAWSVPATFVNPKTGKTMPTRVKKIEA